MPTTKLYRVFTDPEKQFFGNTSSVVLLEKPLPEDLMQKIAADLAQPATTFLHPMTEKDSFGVRWFAPDEEIPVCGHGAAAATAFLAQHFRSKEPFKIHYKTGYLTGELSEDNRLRLTLPAFMVTKEVPVSKALRNGLGAPILAHFKTENKNIVLVENEEIVRDITPDFNTLRQDGSFGYIVTAPGSKTDFVSRTFVPHVGQLEDPATGSSHATLAPFWAERLGKNELTADQLSKRGGSFQCLLKGDQVTLSGFFELIMEGKLILK